MPPKVVRLDGYYRDLAGGAAAFLCWFGMGERAVMQLKGMNQSETAREEYGIMLAALGVLMEHLKRHAPLESGQETDIYMFVAGEAAKLCHEH